jgi:hypothetical protein
MATMQEQIEIYFQQGQVLGIPLEKLRSYLDQSNGDPALAMTSLLLTEEKTQEGTEEMPTKFYNQPTAKELHEASLAEAGKMNDWVNNYFDDHPELDIKDPDVLERVQKIYLKKNEDSGEIITKGYVSEKPSRNYKMSSIEAGNILAARAVKRQRKTKESYEKCFKAEGEADSHLFEIYTQGN